MILPLCLLNVAAEAALPAVTGLTWTEVEIVSTLDGATQPIIIGVPDSYEAGSETPLLVALHTWSSGYQQQAKEYGPLAVERDWLLVLPHFRGPNLVSNENATQAGGSILAQHDVIDAVEHVKREYSVDESRVYLSGASGGGHMALLMAGKHPDVWAAVVSWCPVTDFAAWHGVGNNYAKHIEAVCGGAPGASPEIDFEYLRRSPRTFITNAANTDVLFAHGDRDYTIPTDHSRETYARLRAVGRHRMLFRSWCGGHEAHPPEGLDWAATKTRPARPPSELHIATDEAKWYFWLLVEPSAPLTIGHAVAKVDGDVVKVTTADVGRVAVILATRNLDGAPRVTLDGEPAPGGTWTVQDDVVTLTPGGAETHEWTLTCE